MFISPVENSPERATRRAPSVVIDTRVFPDIAYGGVTIGPAIRLIVGSAYTAPVL